MTIMVAEGWMIYASGKTEIQFIHLANHAMGARATIMNAIHI
jgi:hypothetical protein